MDKEVESILAAEKITNEEYYVAMIDGAECQTLKSFLKNIGKAFKFPDYYGHNLDALAECLNDLGWIDKPNFILFVKNGIKFLSKEPEDVRERLLRLLDNVSMQWAHVPNYEGEDEFRKKADFRIKLL